MLRCLAIPAAIVALTMSAMAQPIDPLEIIEQRVAANGVGMAVAIVEDGEPRFFSTGLTARDDGSPVDEVTLFEIGSITKIFTSLLLAQLVAAGEIDLDAPIANYLPEELDLPIGAARPITARDLATHSSGLPPIPDDLGLDDPDDPYAGYDRARLFDYLSRHEQARPAGESFEYSNTGFALLGAALEHVSGTDYETLVQERILAPLDMTDTVFALDADDEARFARPHLFGLETPAWDFDAFASAGALKSTARDLAKFVAAVSGQAPSELAPVFAIMLAELRAAGQDDMQIGLGWMVRATETGTIVWHNGITGGSNAFIGYSLETGRASVVLANNVGVPGIEDIGFHLIDAALPLAEIAPQREAMALPAETLERYVGTYEITPDFVLTVTREDERLIVQATNQPRFEVFADSETRFFYRVVEAEITFEVDEDGTVTGLVLHQNGQDMPGRRL